VSAIWGAVGLIAAGLGVPAASYLFIPPKERGQGRWMDAGDLSGLEPDSPQEVTFLRTRTDGWKTLTEKASAWVVKHANGRFTAFSPRCTHLACAYHWEGDRKQFVCPCHGSRFAIDGRVLAGPAPRPLDRYEVKVEGARVWLGSERS
jgi:menaquinol-cytochrome c reductase iron-sulfur subunit